MKYVLKVKRLSKNLSENYIKEDSTSTHRRNSMCKIPEAWKYPVNLENNKACGVLRAEIHRQEEC